MVQWQRHIFPILRRIHKGVEHANSSATNLVIYRFGSSLSQGQLQRQWSTKLFFGNIKVVGFSLVLGSLISKGVAVWD
ncbi:hypothetical protein TSUD_16940 [Trifolium subterraneum]|uniref:Uncharacterized protein n=1 Tax=Trifolium subterraneum TaxID=3900 RepID=A0A2Z6MTM7_TRISU|nr:hypothetical protein TSUD_16940 [Trifolium subterraneum]